MIDMVILKKYMVDTNITLMTSVEFSCCSASSF